jgi:hypothetical protein
MGLYATHMQPGVTELPLKRGSRALGLEPVDARCNPEAVGRPFHSHQPPAKLISNPSS